MSSVVSGNGKWTTLSGLQSKFPQWNPVCIGESIWISVDLFLFNGFESVQSLYGITHDDLKQIGVEKLGHRKQLIRCVKKEQERHRKQLLRLIKQRRKATNPRHHM